MFVFRKIWRDLLSCYLRFEIRPFALLRTKQLILFQLIKEVNFMSSEKIRMNLIVTESVLKKK